jgi:hypothetical protein
MTSEMTRVVCLFSKSKIVELKVVGKYLILFVGYVGFDML